MLSSLLDVHGYLFWLLLISLGCWVAERLAPWRPHQRAWRDQIGQDAFWLAFNGHYAGVLLAMAVGWALQFAAPLPGGWIWSAPAALQLLAAQPLWLQVPVFLVARDFLEWCVHNLLHRVAWLWEFHKLHHSILELDWIGSMRFHWMEIIVYKTLTYLPLVILGVRGEAVLGVAVLATLIGHLNHANLNIGWGPLRYVLNSPRMHVWHHDLQFHHRYGQNFGVVFSLWDWLFGTAYLPDGPEAAEAPEHLGFQDLDTFPRGLVARLAYPLWRRRVT